MKEMTPESPVLISLQRLLAELDFARFQRRGFLALGGNDPG
jgi:hypothetical protein